MPDISQTLLDLVAEHAVLAYTLIFAISLGEALFIVGLFVPSTVVLIGAGALVGAGKLPFIPVLVLASVGAAIGDALSFWIGHHYKERVRTVWPFSRYATLLDRGEAFFRAHGGKSIFLGRFVPGIKAIVPGIAGMTGMNFSWFTFVNVTSAVVWAAAHIVPAAGLGLGLSSIGNFDPRLAMVGGALLIVIAGSYFLLKLGFGLALPVFGRWRDEQLATDPANDGYFGRLLRRTLANEDGLIGRSLVLTAAALAVASFATLLTNLLFDPELKAADGAVFNWLQAHRSELGTRIMTTVTMSADAFVITGLSVAMIGWLTFRRHYRVAIAALVAIAGSSLFVPIVKGLLERPRPTVLYEAAQAFSFPSGHAALSMTAFGVIAAIYAAHVRPERRLPIFGFAALAAVVVAFSRLYLGAHWLSDVAAGLSFGIAMTAIFMALTHRLDRAVDMRSLSLVLLPAFALLYGLNLVAAYDRWLIAYSPTPEVRTMAADAWRSGAWRDLPPARITLGGDSAEAFFLQSDAAPEMLARAVAQAGWQPAGVGNVLDAVFPSTAPLSARPVSPLMHDGLEPVDVFVKSAETPEERLVLRFWPSGFSVEPSRGADRILLGSISLERLDPLVGGYATVENAAPASATGDAEAALEEVLARQPGLRLEHQGPVALLVEG